MLDSELFIKSFYIDWDKIDEDSYLRGIEAIRDISHKPFDKSVTFFVGENGTGKSTLLEALAVAYGFNPEGGTRNYSFSTYDSHSELCEAIRLARGAYKPGWGYFLRAESFYNVATAERAYDGDLFLHNRSHGESFLAVVQENFRQNGIYFLDEPEAALSPQRQLSLLYEIVRCAREESQFIIATHSPILLGMPDADIWSFDEESIHSCEYEDTESYQITEMFVNRREMLLRGLFEE